MQVAKWGNKAMKTKRTNILRGKERKNRYAKLEVDKENLFTLKANCKGKRTVGKANKGINVGKV